MSWSRAGAWLIVALAVAAFGLGFGVLSKHILTTMNGQTVLAWLTFVATTGVAIWTFQKTKRREADAQLFSQKAAIYKEIVDVLRDIVFAQKGWIPPLEDQEIAKRLGLVRFDLIIWGGQDTIRAITELEEANSTDIGKAFAVATNLYAKIRKELGHTDDPEFAEDLFLAQIVKEEREAARALLRSRRPAK